MPLFVDDTSNRAFSWGVVVPIPTLSCATAAIDHKAITTITLQTDLKEKILIIFRGFAEVTKLRHLLIGDTLLFLRKLTPKKKALQKSKAN